MATKEENSEKVFATLNPTLHQYYNLANSELETPQPIFDEIIANEDRYKQGVLINQGGMKRILQTVDALTGRPVAMARLHEPENAVKAERFLREARLTAALEHPNIIPVYDIGITEEGDPFFTMKLIGGRSLSSILKSLSKGEEKTDLSLQTLMDIFIKVCDAMAYTHSKGILHLDLKPENIQVGEFGEVLVCDWGLAKVIDSPDELVDTDLDPCLYNDITLDGVIKGTPGFMAPEQIDFELGEKDKRTDVYALGGILYSLLALRPPIDNKDVQKTLDETIEGKIKPPSQTTQNRDVSPSLEAVVMKALCSKQEDRYQSVSELRNEIYKWMGGFATAAENAGFLKSSWLFFKRHKAVGLLLILIVASTIFSLIKIKENENRAVENEQRAVVNEKRAVEALILYEEEKKQTEIIGREASPRLVYMAKQALNLFEFDKALQIVAKAIDRDPNNKVAYAMKGKIHFFRQEFHQAIESFKKSGKFQKHKPYKKFNSLANKFAPLKEKDKDLLTSTKLINLLKVFTNTEDIYKIFRFEVQNYVSLEEHMRICRVMLKHNNPQVETWNFNFSYNDDTASLDISGNEMMSNISCLRNLPIDYLDISGSEAWQDWVIMDMPLTELNISNTKFKTLKGISKMKTLKKLILSKNKFHKFNTKENPELKVIRQ
jgi:serine/threonine protein kinase